MAVERTLVLIKPDAVARGLAGAILSRFEARGLALRGGKLLTVSRELAEQHYAEHTEKPFFGELVEFITSSPTLALVLEGEGAIAGPPAEGRPAIASPDDADEGCVAVGQGSLRTVLGMSGWGASSAIRTSISRRLLSLALARTDCGSPP